MANHILPDPVEIPVLQNVVRAGARRLHLTRACEARPRAAPRGASRPFADLHSAPDVEVGSPTEPATPPADDLPIDERSPDFDLRRAFTDAVASAVSASDSDTIDPRLEALVDELIDRHVTALRRDINTLLIQVCREQKRRQPE